LPLGCAVRTVALTGRVLSGSEHAAAASVTRPIGCRERLGRPSFATLGPL